MENLTRMMVIALALVLLMATVCEAGIIYYPPEVEGEYPAYSYDDRKVAWPFNVVVPYFPHKLQQIGTTHPLEKRFIKGQGNTLRHANLFNVIVSQYNEKLDSLKISNDTLNIINEKKDDSYVLPVFQHQNVYTTPNNQKVVYNVVPMMPFYFLHPLNKYLVGQKPVAETTTMAASESASTTATTASTTTSATDSSTDASTTTLAPETMQWEKRSLPNNEMFEEQNEKVEEYPELSAYSTQYSALPAQQFEEVLSNDQAEDLLDTEEEEHSTSMPEELEQLPLLSEEVVHLPSMA